MPGGGGGNHNQKTVERKQAGQLRIIFLMPYSKVVCVQRVCWGGVETLVKREVAPCSRIRRAVDI